LALDTHYARLRTVDPEGLSGSETFRQGDEERALADL